MKISQEMLSNYIITEGVTGFEVITRPITDNAALPGLTFLLSTDPFPPPPHPNNTHTDTHHHHHHHLLLNPTQLV